MSLLQVGALICPYYKEAINMSLLQVGALICPY